MSLTHVPHMHHFHIMSIRGPDYVLVTLLLVDVTGNRLCDVVYKACLGM